MKFPSQDFPLIRTAVILLASSAFLGAASIAGSFYLKDLMRQHRQDDQRRLAETRTKLERVREEEQQIRLYQAKYQGLLEQGVIGKENRLSLIESIARIKVERKLFEFSYQIAAQQPVQTDVAFSQSEFGLHGSRMKLSLAVLHEEDWLNTLNDLKEKNTGVRGGAPTRGAPTDLKEKNTGVSLLRECTVTRNGDAANNSISPKLNAECAMIWLSLRPKSGAELPKPGTR